MVKTACRQPEKDVNLDPLRQLLSRLRGASEKLKRERSDPATSALQFSITGGRLMFSHECYGELNIKSQDLKTWGPG